LNESVDIGGQLVVVSGATGRLGRHLVSGFAAAGARVVGIVRPTVGQYRSESNESTVPCDLADEASVASCFGEIEREHGRIFACLHAVGTWEMKPFGETSLADWDEMMQVNLRTAFLCFRHAIAGMGDGPGRLVVFASRQGADRGAPQQAAYSAAKGGLVRLVESVALEYGPRITATAIAPSAIAFEDGHSGGVAAKDLVKLCLFVCSGAGAALNGQTLRAYGTG
jgi:NAD(P)-dependent dehydrogenase (short-subunit alcohol dehydrogenase family)